MNLTKNIRNTAKSVLNNEADAVKKIADYIDDDFEQSVLEILESRGRVVVTGIGKSANVAHKIVATLNSTGTPSLFMHAADAIHGDLGMVQSDDIVICISKSGNTEEIKVLIPLLKRRGSKLIALVSNTKSYLAEHADYVLNATIESEACPNNLAPTTSTTAHMALGDALAVSLLDARGFTSDDFAQYHPGGSLGKRLYLRVSDIYPANPVPKVSPDSSLKTLIIEISSNRLGATAVVNEQDELIGLITDGDLRRMLERGEELAEVKAEDLMSMNPKVVDKEDYAVKALRIMQENDITQVIVTEGKKVLGFVHLHDCLKEGLI